MRVNVRRLAHPHRPIVGGSAECQPGNRYLDGPGHHDVDAILRAVTHEPGTA